MLRAIDGEIEKRDAAVGLRVEIDEQRLASAHGQRGGEVDGGRGLADAAFLIGDGDDHAADAGDATSAWCRAASELS